MATNKWDNWENWDVIGDIERALDPEVDPKTGWPKRERYGENMPPELRALLTNYEEKTGIKLSSA